MFFLILHGSLSSVFRRVSYKEPNSSWAHKKIRYCVHAIGPQLGKPWVRIVSLFDLFSRWTFSDSRNSQFLFIYVISTGRQLIYFFSTGTYSFMISNS